MSMSARFAAWVWTVTGAELTVERVYTQNNVYRYLQECMRDRSESHRWGLVRQLGTIAETLTEMTSIRRLPAPHLPGRAPFTLSEVGVIHGWAMALRTQLQRQNAWAILGLAGGAGLRSHEIVETRLGDIETTPAGLIVTVRGHRHRHARRVPVTPPWNRTLLRSIEGRADPDEFVFRGYRWDEYRPRAIQTFLTEHPSRVRPTVSRLRSTWIITHLNSGASLTVIMAIAGFVSTESLDRHLIHAAPPSLDDYFASTAGGENPR
jgi:integrase